MNDESIMPFGQYKGRQLEQIPASYLIWLYDNNRTNKELKKYIEENIDVLRHEVNAIK